MVAKHQPAKLIAAAWRTFIAATNLLIALAFGFTKLGSVPLDARLVIVGGASFLLWSAVLVVFLVVFSTATSRKPYIGFAIIMFVESFITFGALDLVVTYHSVRILREDSVTMTDRFMIDPPRFPVDFDIQFFTAPNGAVTLKSIQQEQLGPLYLPADTNKIGTALQVLAFRHPQQLRVVGELSAPGQMEYEVFIKSPKETDVLAEEELWNYRTMFAIFAVGLFISAGLVIYWYSRS